MQNSKTATAIRTLKLFFALLVGLFALHAIASPAYTDGGEDSDNGVALLSGGSSSTSAQRIGFNSTVNGSLDSQSKGDWYSFTVPESGIVYLDYKAYIKEFSLELYDSPQSTNWIWCDTYIPLVNSNEYSADTLEFPLNPGTYYLKAGKMYYPGDYSLQLRFASADATEVEPNDSPTRANRISAGDLIRGVLSQAGDSDWFEFILTNPSTITLDYEAYVREFSLELYDDPQSTYSIWARTYLVPQNSNEFASGSFDIPLDPGTYYLKVGKRYYYGKYSIQTALNGQINVDVPESDNPNVQYIYRLYNRTTGEHLFSTNPNEVRTLVNRGWKFEGVGWNAPSSSNTPVYRLYNRFTGDHHYTTNLNEYNTCGQQGWNQEGIGWYSDDSKGKPLYRLYNPYTQVGTHHYTADRGEYDSLPSGGWKQEGVAWYGLS